MILRNVLILSTGLIFSCADNNSQSELLTMEKSIEPSINSNFEFNEFKENSNLLDLTISNLSVLLKTELLLNENHNKRMVVEKLCSQSEYLISEVDILLTFSEVDKIFEKKLEQVNQGCYIYNDIISEHFNLTVEIETKVMLKEFELEDAKISSEGYLIQRRIMIQTSILFLLTNQLLESSGISINK